MHEAHVVLGIASVSSLLAIIATMITVPSLYSQMNELSLRVHDGVEVINQSINQYKLFIHPR